MATIGKNDAVSPPAIQSVVPRGRALRRAMSMATVAWIFGSVWMTATSGAPLTQFARSLGASNFQFGLLSALPFIASLASMPASLWIDRTGARKSIFLWSLYGQRLMWFVIALVPLWIVRSHGDGAIPLALAIALWLIFFMHTAAAIGSPAWVSWMADLVPDRTRGKYFSQRRQWGIVSSIPAAWIAGWLLDRPAVAEHLGQPTIMLGWCAIIFCCAAVFGVTDIALFHFVEEIPARPREHQSLLRLSREVLRNRPFLWFGGFVATMTFAVSFMGQFVTLFLIEKLHVSNRSVQMMLLIAPMLAPLLTLGAWGVAVDRFGKRPVMVISTLALVPVAFGWCLMNGGGPGAIILGYILSAAGAALWAGVEVANFNLVLEFSGADNGASGDNANGGSAGSSYVAVNSVIINIAGLLGGLASGAIAQGLRNWHWDIHLFGLEPLSFYEILFAISGVLRLLSVIVFLPMIHEPQARPAHEALRFMTANIYDNLFNVMFLPLRVIGFRPTKPDKRD